MRRIGEVVRTAGGLAVARCGDDEQPAVGTELVDQHLDPIGEVVDVFGPVDRPFLAVLPAADDPVSLVGTVCYAR
jgi:RNA-binding protein